MCTRRTNSPRFAISVRTGRRKQFGHPLKFIYKRSRSVFLNEKRFCHKKRRLIYYTAVSYIVFNLTYAYWEQSHRASIARIIIYYVKRFWILLLDNEPLTTALGFRNDFSSHSSGFHYRVIDFSADRSLSHAHYASGYIFLSVISTRFCTFHCTVTSRFCSISFFSFHSTSIAGFHSNIEIIRMKTVVGDEKNSYCLDPCTPYMSAVWNRNLDITLKSRFRSSTRRNII